MVGESKMKMSRRVIKRDCVEREEKVMCSFAPFVI